MGSNKKHIAQIEEYQRYLDGSMNSKERHAFEKKLLEDEFEEEAMEGFSQIDPDQINSDLKLLQNRLKEKTNKKGFVIWRAVASVAILGIFSFLIYFVLNRNGADELALNKQNNERIEEAPEEEILVAEQDSLLEREEPILALRQQAPERNEEITIARESSPARAQAISDEIILGESDEVSEELEAIALNNDEAQVAEDVEVPDEPIRMDLPTIEPEEATKIEDQSARKKSFSGRVAGARISPSSSVKSNRLLQDDGMKTISGNVYSSEDDEVLPGVNVIVKGSTSGVVTDVEGNYQIEVPEDEDVTLVFSSVGFNTEEVEIADQETIDVDVQPDLTALSEIVVVGYGESEDEAEASYSYKPPRPEGGRGNFRDYIKENMVYPESAKEEKIKGTVKLRFEVGAKGEIGKLKVIKSLGEDFDQEAIRLLQEGPAWEPAIENDSTVIREVKLKIRFRAPG